MLTFQNLYEEAQDQVEDDSSNTLIRIKRAINVGAKKFGAVLNREWRKTQKTFSIEGDQQFYQTPEDCLKVKSVKVTVGSNVYYLTEIVDEDTWEGLNSSAQTSSTPMHFYVRGNDEFGIWPTPSADISSGGTLTYERRMRDMSAADYTTGTVAVTAASQSVVGTGTTFTTSMVGRSLRIDDPNGDGMWYKISAFTDTTHISLENTYAGATASGQSYTIGELPDIPEEYHESLIDYACWRYYIKRRDSAAARDMKASYKESLEECKANYSSKTTSQYLRVRRTAGSGITNVDRQVT